MKVISLLQPWATLVVIRDKFFETRSWNTPYRGDLLIHASAKKPDRFKINLIEDWILKYKIPLYTEENYPTGAIIGKVKLVDVAPSEIIFTKSNDKSFGYEIPEKEFAFGDYSPGRFGWLLSDPVEFKKPIPFKGQLGLRDVPESIMDQLNDMEMIFH